MSQHFLLSSESRQLSIKKVARLTDDEALEVMVKLRWGDSGTQCCPACGVVRKHFFLKTRTQWRCADKECGHTFSVTSGTIFASHKLPLKDILYAAALYVHAVKGMSALQLSRHLEVEHKTAYVLFHKLRDALWTSRDLTPLKNEVEIDGGYFNYHVRPNNKRKNRVDRRSRFNMNPMKRAILAMRERGEAGKGARRTIVEVIKQENERDVSALVKRHVEAGTTIFSDEHTCYTALAARHPVKQVNHAEEYSTDDGVNENQAESFFSRMRRMIIGQIHKCAGKYLVFYANEIAWREDNRRESSLFQFNDLVGKCLHSRQSKNWSKYWQGNHLEVDTLFAAG